MLLRSPRWVYRATYLKLTSVPCCRSWVICTAGTKLPHKSPWFSGHLPLAKRPPPDSSKFIDVVVSGPDATFTARDTGVVMRQLFTAAKSRILAVGFAVHQGRSVFRTLAERLDSEDGLQVTLCLDVRRAPGSTSIDNQIAGQFARNFVEHEWPGQRLPLVYFDPRSLTDQGASRSALHSKCVVIDGKEALVTSANFTEAAQERNMELGLLVRAPEIASQIEEHFHSLIRNGHLERLPLTK